MAGRSYDVSPGNRASGRLRLTRVFLTAGGSGVARAVSAFAGFLTVPMLLDYLGKDGYGVLGAITSAVVVFGFTDLGVGNAVLNGVSDAYGRNDGNAMREVVSSAFVALAALSGLILAVVAVATVAVDWVAALNAGEIASAPAVRLTVFSVGACLVVNTLFSLPQRVQQGLQRGYETALWQAASSILMIGLLAVAVGLRAGMPLLGAILVGTQAFGALAAGVRLWSSTPAIRPSLASVTRARLRQLLGSGAMFSWLQLCHVLTVAIDGAIIAAALDPIASAEYSVPARLFSLVPVATGLFQLPLWPAYREALSGGDAAWVRRVVARALVITAVSSGALVLFLVVAVDRLLILWVGPGFAPTTSLLAGLGLWTWLYATGSSLTVFLHASQRLRFQAFCWGAFVLLATTGKLVLAGRFGAWVVPWVSSAAYLAALATPMALTVPGFLQSACRAESSVRVGGAGGARS